MAKRGSLPFDKKGGVVVVQRRLLSSPAYLGLTAQAKVLMMLLQRHWSASGPVDFGVRQAQEEIPCSKTLAMRAFKELENAGFIVMVDESLFSSRTQSKTRTWRLTWLPCWRHRAPTNDWEHPREHFYRSKNDTCSKPTGTKYGPVESEKRATGTKNDTCGAVLASPQVPNMDHTYLSHTHTTSQPPSAQPAPAMVSACMAEWDHSDQEDL